MPLLFCHFNLLLTFASFIYGMSFKHWCRNILLRCYWLLQTAHQPLHAIQEAQSAVLPDQRWIEVMLYATEALIKSSFVEAINTQSYSARVPISRAHIWCPPLWNKTTLTTGQ